jgi:hypothetical protein
MRGYFFTVFGTMAFMVPSITVATFAIACAAYALVVNIFRLFSKNDERAYQPQPGRD